MEKDAVKSRKARRKEARLAKQQQRLQSRVHHQAFMKRKRDKLMLSKSNKVASPCDRKYSTLDKKVQKCQNNVEPNDTSSKSSRMKGSSDKRSSTKFEEYIKMEEQKTISADEDLLMEQQLAKRLKVKEGKLGGSKDGLNDLMDGLFSCDDYVEVDFETQRKEKKKKKKPVEPSDAKSKPKKLSEESTSSVKRDPNFLGHNESSEMSMEVDVMLEDAKDKCIELEGSEACVEGCQGNVNDTFRPNHLCNSMSKAAGTSKKTDQQINTESSLVKYVAPHLRSNLTDSANESAQTRRHIRGLLNRLSECNVESVAAEISSVFQSHGRSLVAQIVAAEVVASCSKGPRGNEQYAAVFAAFVSGIAASVGMDFGAKLFASLATSFEEEHRREDGLALRNITLLLSYLYIFGLCSSDLIYDLLDSLSKRLEELDVSVILTILQCCGMCLRSDDPAAMKDFIFGIQQHVHELKALASGTQDRNPIVNGKRMEYMLETICDIKNNKKRPKEESSPHARLKKWLQKLRVDDVQLRCIKWSKLLDPNKKGQWWLSGDMETAGKDCKVGIADVIDAEVAEAQKMLHLASSQRMNTEARRAIFCIIMSGEDYLDAFEKILRLTLPGKQDREIVRVLVDCCLQEKVFNKYYSLLAAKLCHHDKNHKFSLQYCLWDQFKQLDSMELRRLANLARFLADLIGSFSLSLSVLKAIDFTDCAMLTSKVIVHFRILFETLFTEFSDNVIWNIFTRIASFPELENLRNGLELFIYQHVNKNALTEEQLGPPESGSLIVSKCKVAKKALTNVAGILM
ncbi:uncharacterized protein LOC131052122 [Cryptomeria japonica]|uniref:uncharacterized protein LOC131052122 n=1 Tax=Cryptomeria japonica TaxID=3369 RepID=UPI0027DAA6A2|nr:uncharacterized protein LOC131052122 [Cryptomeria japonica]XP_057842705.2 uncharacterized protein LOC131052122 [Cryptomeria japonica]XP_059075790.1 uncharacterized protein LOC131052122 [Cryptomeria japonica]